MSQFADYYRAIKEKKYRDKVNRVYGRDQEMIDGDSISGGRFTGYDTPESISGTDKYNEIVERTGMTNKQYDEYANRAKKFVQNKQMMGLENTNNVTGVDSYGRALYDSGTLGKSIGESRYSTTGALFTDAVSQAQDRVKLEKIA